MLKVKQAKLFMPSWQKVVEGKGSAVTRRFSLHQKFSNATDWMIINSHNFVFKYACIFGLQDFYCTIIQKHLCLIGILPRFNPISTGGPGGAFHLQPSKWLRTRKRNKPLSWNFVTFPNKVLAKFWISWIRDRRFFVAMVTNLSRVVH